MNKKPIILAFCGKGGVGKTSLSSICIRLLNETYKDKKILAIDADPAIGLATALGIKASSTVDDIRKLFIQKVEEGNNEKALELLSEAKYQIYDSLVEVNNVSFLAIGRPESAGCYCKVNAYLKGVISIIANNYDFVVIDGEAGIEQINRRVMEKVTHLILVSDCSKKGIDVCRTIEKVSKEAMMCEYTGLILNRVTDKNLLKDINLDEFNLLGIIENDNEVIKSDIKGDSMFILNENSIIINSMKEILRKINLIK